LFSRQPSGHSWNVNPYPRYDDNNDWFWIYEMHTYNPFSTDFLGTLLSLTPLFLLIFVGVIGIVYGSVRYGEWRDSKPQAYITKKRWVGGTHYDLGGTHNALLFTLNKVLGDKETRFDQDLKQWAGMTLGIDLLNESDFNDQNSRLWKEIYNGINVNSGGIYHYLIDRYPFGCRTEQFEILCSNESIHLSDIERTFLQENLEEDIENVRTRWREEKHPYRKISSHIDEIRETVSRIDEKLPEGTAEELASLLSADVEVGRQIEAVGVSLGLSETDIIHLLDKTRSSEDALTFEDIQNAVREVLDEIDLNQNLDRFYEADPVVIEELLTKIDEVSTNKEKGDAMESLCEYVFKSISGFRVKRNIRAKTGEIDLFVTNHHTRVPFLHSLGERFIVEAKNWNEKIGVEVIDRLFGKMLKYEVHFAILATKNGISGNILRDGKRSILKVRDSYELEVIDIDLDDFKQLAVGKSLIELLIEKRQEKTLE